MGVYVYFFVTLCFFEKRGFFLRQHRFISLGSVGDIVRYGVLVLCRVVCASETRFDEQAGPVVNLQGVEGVKG